MRTTLSHLSSAEICRQQGWQIGTLLDGSARDNGHRVRVRIRITAIGERSILARLCLIGGVNVETASEEAIYDLHCRDWEAV